MLGLSVQSEDATPALIAYLRNKRMLILDTYEHLIEAVAAVTSQIYAKAPQVHILATSREVLQVEDEHVYRQRNPGGKAASEHDGFPQQSARVQAPRKVTR